MTRLSSLIKYCVLLVLLLCPLQSFADDFPPLPNPPRLVNDLAHMMSPDQQQLLETKLREFNNTTSNQVAIVTIKSIGNYEITDYAFKLGRKWGIGTSKNNGVLIIAALNEHKMTIAVGRGLEGALPDITAGQIINREMKPLFRENKYYEGFDRATNAVIAATKGEYKADPKDKNSSGTFIPIFFIALGLIMLFAFVRSRRQGGRYISRRGYDDFGGGGVFWGGTGWGSSGGWDSGSSGGDSGGSDFGGFGGGDFGGGGASGDW